MRDIKTRFRDKKPENYMTILSQMRFEKQLRDLLQKPMPNHNEILAMSNMMMLTPDWFKRMKLCMNQRFYLTETKPCNKFDYYYRCYEVYNKTVHMPMTVESKYSNNVCPKKVGLFTYGYEPWFENVELCFRWRQSRETQVAKCVYERQGTFCTKLNTVILQYPNIADSGCRVQWMLSIPTEAPFWIQGTQLCVWYNCYSLGRRSKLIKTYVRCAHPNTYTYDNPYGSRLKCYVKLGILPNKKENL